MLDADLWGIGEDREFGVSEKVFNFLERPPLTFGIIVLVDVFDDGAEEIVLVVVEGSDFTEYHPTPLFLYGRLEKSNIP